jgi:hypothetical protein
MALAVSATIRGVPIAGIFLDESGFYALSESEAFASISSPETPKGMTAQGIDRTVQRIAWGNINQGYSIFDPENREAIFGVPLDGAVTPNYEIVFNLQNQTWTLFKRAEWTACGHGTLPGGGPMLIAGDREGNVWHVGIGESDGYYDDEAVKTLTGTPTVRTLTVSGETFASAKEGGPVLVLYADGETVAYGKIASVATGVLTLAEDLDTAPAAGDQIVVGGMAFQAKTGFTTFGEELREKDLRCVTIRHAPATRGDYFLSVAVNGGDFALCPVGTSIGDLTEADGKVTHDTLVTGDTHAINIRGFKPGGRAIIRGGIFDFSYAEVGRV